MTKEFPTARDLMTTAVVSVPPDMPVASLGRLLADRGISAVPVTDAAGALLGIVTEADLLRRLAGAEDKPVGWLRGLFSNPEQLAHSYARTHGKTAQDIMTPDVVIVAPEASAAHCAHQLVEHGIRRLPVVDGGRLVGVVSRADLLRAAVDASDPIGTPIQEGDAAIRAALWREVRKEPWADVYYMFPDVKEGVVTLHGFVSSDAVRRAMRVLAERIEGVVRVEDRLAPLPRTPVVGI